MPPKPTKAPPKFTVDYCPHCGQKVRRLNGRYLKHLRQQAGLDQRAFGDRVGLSSPYLSDIERNRRDCPPSIQQAYERLSRSRVEQRSTRPRAGFEQRGQP